ncbi:MAG: hypothetical protein L0241_17245, partial [Planctomycetia bacterium]|nr:hypothetical protein [Planctomycetia bacterium]
VENGLGAIFDNRTARPAEIIKATLSPYQSPCFQGVGGHNGHLFAPPSDQTLQILGKTPRGEKQGGGGGGVNICGLQAHRFQTPLDFVDSPAKSFTALPNGAGAWTFPLSDAK